MGKIPIYYKAYDNGYRILMGISISLGLSALLYGLATEEVGVIVLGVISIVFFFIFKYLNYARAKEEAEENAEARMNFFKKEVDTVLNSQDITNEDKLEKIIKLSKQGNEYATIILIELQKKIEENK